MRTQPIERDTELRINTQLINLGWNINPNAKKRNVYQQRVKTEAQRAKLDGKRPDYILYPTDSDTPLAIIEAKRPGRNIQDAMDQGIRYATAIGAPIVFATDGVFTKSIHVQTKKALKLNEEDLDELIRESFRCFIAVDEVARV